MVKKGFLYDKGTPSSNLISRHEQTYLIFPENEKRLAKTFVPMFLCLKHLSLKKYVTMSFCLKNLFFCHKNGFPMP